jgi:hypothetical protein
MSLKKVLESIPGGKEALEAAKVRRRALTLLEDKMNMDPKSK